MVEFVASLGYGESLLEGWDRGKLYKKLIQLNQSFSRSVATLEDRYECAPAFMPRDLPKRNEGMCPHKYLHTNIYKKFTCFSKKL